jgi:WD40 repeat protein
VAHPQIGAFPRLGNGGTKPARVIAGQNTMFTRTMHSISYDPLKDEVVVPQFYAQAVLVFRGAADGNEAPVRVIYGPDTQLMNPDRLNIDPVHREVFVPESNSADGDYIVVLPLDVNGNTKPLRLLKGPDTRGVSAVAIDPVRNLLVATGGGKIRIFDRLANGTDKPKYVINHPAGLVEVYPPKGLIFASVGGRDDGYVGVWNITDNGDVAPRWRIGGPGGMLHNIRGVTLDPKNKDVIITDKDLNGILTYHFPEVF